jgi:glucosylceramidase
VVWGGQSFTYALQALSGATFTWSGPQVAGYSVDALNQQIQASSYNDTMGLQTELTADSGGGYDLGYANDGAWALYKNIDFGTSVKSVVVRAASAGSGGALEFHIGSVSGPLIGSATIPVTGGWQTWTNVPAAISGASGINDLYIVFKGTTNIGNVNWFQFRKKKVKQPKSTPKVTGQGPHLKGR